MKCGILTRALASIFAVSVLTALPARADILKAELKGVNEVPSISTAGAGEFRALLSKDETEIDFELSYWGLSSPVAQAHIHFGQRHTNGGVMIFLCGGNMPACPPAPAKITGTLSAGLMVGAAAAQGIAAGEFAEMVDAIRSGAAYVNVHTQTFPNGEIRNQISAFGFSRKKN